MLEWEVFIVNRRKKTARGIRGSLPPWDRERTGGKRWEEGANCQGYRSREDSKIVGRVLAVMKGFAPVGGDRLAGTAWEPDRGSALLEAPLS